MRYYLILFLVKSISHLPFCVMYVLSDLLYFPLYYVVRYRRKTVRKNLTESFPNKSLPEIISIEKKFYHFLMDMILESCKLASMSCEEMKKRMNFVNAQVVNDILAEGKSISAFLGHYGNWEWMSSMALWLNEGSVAAQIYHRLQNKGMDDIVEMLRSRMGNVCVNMHKTARYIAATKDDDKSYIIGFIADHSPKRREIKHYTPFLNHSVPVVVGTEKLTKHYGYEAVFVSMRRVKRGYYESTFSLLHEDPKSLPDYELTDLYFRRLEEDIINQPELYLWTHNRFKYAEK